MRCCRCGVRRSRASWSAESGAVGIYRDANTVRDAFRRTPDLLYLDDWADQILSRISFLQTDTKLNLVLVTVSDLGFGADGASLKDIYGHALSAADKSEGYSLRWRMNLGELSWKSRAKRSS